MHATCAVLVRLIPLHVVPVNRNTQPIDTDLFILPNFISSVVYSIVAFRHRHGRIDI